LLNQLLPFLPEITIKQLEYAISNNRPKSIDWLLSNGAPWLETENWESRYSPDITDNYAVWKFATEKIIEKEGLIKRY
jgi:hypothetical protein